MNKYRVYTFTLSLSLIAIFGAQNIFALSGIQNTPVEFLVPIFAYIAPFIIFILAIAGLLKNTSATSGGNPFRRNMILFIIIALFSLPIALYININLL